MSESLPIVPPDRPDRDSLGRFMVGRQSKAGPGRPRAIDFRRVAEEHAAICGTHVESELWAIFLKMIELAKGGDTQAAKFVFGLFVDQDPVQLHVTQSDGLTDTERAVRIEALLRIAAGRRRAAEAAEKPKEGNGLPA